MRFSGGFAAQQRADFFLLVERALLMIMCERIFCKVGLSDMLCERSSFVFNAHYTQIFSAGFFRCFDLRCKDVNILLAISVLFLDDITCYVVYP